MSNLPEDVKLVRTMLEACGRKDAEDAFDRIVLLAQAPLPAPDDNEIGAFSADASDTSRNAAIDVFPRTGTQRRNILDSIASEIGQVGGKGLTDEQIEERQGLRHQTCSARRRELVLAGWIEDSGETRVNQSGSEATIWALTRKATDMYQTRFWKLP